MDRTIQLELQSGSEQGDALHDMLQQFTQWAEEPGEDQRVVNPEVDGRPFVLCYTGYEPPKTMGGVVYVYSVKKTDGAAENSVSMLVRV